MARRASQVDPCLICMSLPCQCDKPARAKATPRRAPSRERASQPVQPTVEPSVPSVNNGQSMLERMRARAAASPSPTPISNILEPPPVRAKPTAASAELRALEPDDAAEVAAIRALQSQFQVEGDAVVRWQPYLEKEPSRAERSAAWRMKSR